MMRPGSSLFVLAIVKSTLAIIDPTASTSPCVSSRSVSPAIQTDISSGCQSANDITPAVCYDYLAQEILTAVEEYCGNQTEAYAYCTGTIGSTPAQCINFNPSGGGSAVNCTTYAVSQVSSCGTNYGLFGAGDPVSLTQCLFFNLGLCLPEDGVGHYDMVPFQGQTTDCYIPPYTPACGVYSTSSSPPTTTAPSAAATSTSQPTLTTSFMTLTTSSSPQLQSPTFVPTATSSTITPLTTPVFSPMCCPIGQTLVAYTSVYY